MTQLRIPALYMRGGTSKGVFFRKDDLPADASARERLLLRVIGSPDPYGKHTDGMGGATSSTSKVVILSRSARHDSDVDYLFGQVAIDAALIDWSGNCGNLSAAVGPAAIALGLVDAPADGDMQVRIWQANIGKRIHARVRMAGGEPVEEGAFELDGVAFPASEVPIEFLDPVSEDDTGAMFPTGSVIETLEVPGAGAIEASLVNAGIPTAFVDAAALGLAGTELPPQVNADSALLARTEAIRAHAAVAMGLAATPQQATRERPHTPKLCIVAPPATYMASNGRSVAASEIDLLARVFSMGQLHHAMTGTGAVALAVAAAIPGTLVHRVSSAAAAGPVRFGHPSGTLKVGAEVCRRGDNWLATKVVMSRSARRLMEGWVRVPRSTEEDAT
jgi:2-methylaconitate isomerase